MIDKRFFVGILLGVALLFGWGFRYEYSVIRVNAHQQNLPSNIKYEMIIRTNRFTNSRCVFHGGGQVIETYPGVGLGIKRETLSANQKLNNCF